MIITYKNSNTEHYYNFVIKASAMEKVMYPGLSKEQQQILEYIKSLNIVLPFYHGTSEYVYQKILEKGYILSPYAMGTSDKESRARDAVSTKVDPKSRVKGTDQIFYTTDVQYAASYASRTANQINKEVTKEEIKAKTGKEIDVAIVLELMIPVYMISEITIPAIKQIENIDI